MWCSKPCKYCSASIVKFDAPYCLNPTCGKQENLVRYSLSHHTTARALNYQIPQFISLKCCEQAFHRKAPCSNVHWVPLCLMTSESISEKFNLYSIDCRKHSSWFCEIIQTFFCTLFNLFKSCWNWKCYYSYSLYFISRLCVILAEIRGYSIIIISK